METQMIKDIEWLINKYLRGESSPELTISRIADVIDKAIEDNKNGN